MPSLTDLIQTIVDEGAEDDPEDMFAAAPGLIFPDDLRNSHGDERCTTIYKSRRFGDIELRTADPEAEDERQLLTQTSPKRTNTTSLGSWLQIATGCLASITIWPGRCCISCIQISRPRSSRSLASILDERRWLTSFDVAAEQGLEVAEIYEEDAEGRRREWLKERDGGREDHTARKRWLVIARLRRRARMEAMS